MCVRISVVKPVSWSLHQYFSLGVSAGAAAAWVDVRGFARVRFCADFF